jgi:hypothetical protein
MYMATKAEETFVKATDMASACGCDLKTMLADEIVLLTGCKFHLRIYSPSRALKGFISTLKKQHPTEDWEAVKAACFKLISRALQAPGFLLLESSPAQLALAALCLTVPDKLDPALKTKAAVGIAALMPLQNKAVATKHQETDRKAVSAALSKLKLCLNPHTTPGSTEFEKAKRLRRAEQDRIEQATLSRESREEEARMRELLLGDDGNDNHDNTQFNLRTGTTNSTNTADDSPFMIRRKKPKLEL